MLLALTGAVQAVELVGRENGCQGGKQFLFGHQLAQKDAEKAGSGEGIGVKALLRRKGTAFS